MLNPRDGKSPSDKDARESRHGSERGLPVQEGQRHKELEATLLRLEPSMSLLLQASAEQLGRHGRTSTAGPSVS